MDANFTGSHIISSEIIRQYDIRGTFGKNLHTKDAYYIALSLATLMQRMGLNGSVCIGYDGRLSSPMLFDALVLGFKKAHYKIIDIGLVPTPELYFSAFTIPGAIAAIMITGSHNPPEHNGFKIVINGATLYGDTLQELRRIAIKGEFNIVANNSVNNIEKCNVSTQYIEKLSSSVLCSKDNHLKGFKIAWDTGNGAAGNIVEQLIKKLPGNHIAINTTIDGTFPSHHPDPTKIENMQQLIEVVKQNNCDLGLAFDGDGDRLGAVDNEGNIIYGDQLLLIFAYDLLKRIPKAKIIVDIKTSQAIFDQIEKWGGVPIMWKTGHSLIKAKMKEEGALLAGEMSGHIFFAENYYGYDDAIFGACQLVKLIAEHEDIKAILGNLPKLYSTSEVRIACNDEIKFQIIEVIKQYLKDNNILFNDLDGVRINNNNGWWLLRASNTESCIVARLEAKNQASIVILAREINNALKFTQAHLRIEESILLEYKYI